MTDPRLNNGASAPNLHDLSSFSNISSSTAQLVCDLNMAQRFLTRLDEDADQFTFQTFAKRVRAIFAMPDDAGRNPNSCLQLDRLCERACKLARMQN